MEEGMSSTRYWCHMCSQVVNPIMETEFKCSICHSGFVEDVTSTNIVPRGSNESELASERALSLWAPILFGIMGSRHRRPQRRNAIESNHYDTESHSRDTRNGERGSFFFTNPLHQTIILQGSPRLNHIGQNLNQNIFGSFGDYFIGQSLDLLLQHLAENDPNRYGTPPTQKGVVEALPMVKINKNLQCSICLDDFDMGAEAKEMPCMHKFHSECIFPWLELHSSCPVCRYELPKGDVIEGPTNSSNIISIPNGSENESGNRGLTMTFRWPFTTFLPSLEPLSTGGDSSAMASTSSSPSSTGAPQASSRTDGN